jgi:DNA replication and repair protein RecF
MHLAQKDPLYLHHLSRYWRAMKQRNALLKTSDDRAIECWEIEMADSAAYLWKMREGFIEALKLPLQANGHRLSSGKEHYDIRFLLSSGPGNYLAQLEKNRLREKMLGNTLSGPHRDDFSIGINHLSSRSFASEGQKKTAAFGLRLAEWELFKEIGKTPALLCVDDLGLHLDRNREGLFQTAIEKLGQTFITTPEEGVFKYEKARLFRVLSGCIQNA